jgi:phosphoribosylanthranilate isomerase
LEEALNTISRGPETDGPAAANTSDQGQGRLPRGPVVKLCGLTRPEDVLAACALGVWSLGFVFAASPRRLTPEAARVLAEEARGAAAAEPGQSQGTAPLLAGVFVDSAAGDIAEIVREVGLDAVQLHGLRGPSVAEVRAALDGLGRGVLVIRAVPVDPDTLEASALGRAIVQAREEADVVLLDTRTSARFGGSGTAFPWPVAREAVRSAGPGFPLLLAGGIGPENVRTALTESGAWGVDVSSGVESAPGIKERRLMERLVAQVKQGKEL